MLKPTVVIPKDPKKREEMIFALEYQLANDTNEKDKEIHRAALEKLKAAIEKKARRKGGLLFFRWFTLFYAPLLGWLVFVYKVFYKSVYALSRVVTGVSRN